MLKKNFIFLFCLLFSIVGFSQSKILRGVVVDEHNNPIEGVHVSQPTLRNNSITNAEGEFRIRIKDAVSKIEISHISYFPQAISLNDKSFNEKIKVVLISKINNLNEVTIDRKKYDQLTGSYSKHIYDYEVNENLIYILSEIGDHNYLEVWSDDLANKKRIKLDFTPTGLVIDCFKNIHIQSELETMQILLKAEDIHILDARSVDEYNYFIKPCVACTDSLLIFTYIDPSIKEQYYYSIDKTTFEVKLFHTIKDSVLAKANVTPLQTLDYLKMADIENSTGIPLLMNENKCLFRMGREMIHLEVLLNNHLLTTPDNPFFKVDSTFLIIDQVNGNGINFSSLTLDSISKVPFSFHKIKGYKNKILKDHSKEVFYSVSKIEDRITLSELDTLLEVRNNFVLKHHFFPENIKVHRGYVYYLVRNNKDYISHKQLIRIALP